MATTTTFAKKEPCDYVANLTFSVEEQVKFDKTLVLKAWIQFCISNRQTLHIYGDHGIGKTAAMFSILEGLGLKVVYVNLANKTPGDMTSPGPVRLEDGELALRQLIDEPLDPDVPYVIILDDGNQASVKVKNVAMQLSCAWELGMHKLPNLQLVIMADNEGAAEGIRASEDPAQADRKVTVRLKANDTGWRYALARKYASTDLAGVFRIWDSLDPELRFVLSPRCLDHVIYAGLNGFPLIWALPLMNGTRVRLVATKKSKAGESVSNDRTEEVLDKVAAGLGVPNRDTIPDGPRLVVRAAMRDQLCVLIQGPPGCGKTEMVKEEVLGAGFSNVYYSMPLIDPENLVVPMPSREGKMVSLIAEELLSLQPYVITWDEYNRPSSPAAFAKLMEMTQQWSIAGKSLTNCTAQIALCNPPTWLGRKMNVMRNNIAQADRFTLSIDVNPDDMGANEWLIANYGETAETVLEWYKNDIGDEHRQWITKRTLERFIKLAKGGMPLENGKVYLGEGEFAPVPLIDLEARLAKRPMARLGEISADLEGWAQKLRTSSETTTEGTVDLDTVFLAFRNAELSQLEKHFETVVRLYPFFPGKLKGPFFIGAKPEATTFWLKVLNEIAKRLEQDTADAEPATS